MLEYLVCDTCTATISTANSVCEFCGSDYRHGGSSGEILRLVDELEKKLFTTDISELLNYISKSKYKNHPAILFRKAKALLLDYMTNDGVLSAGEFCEVIKIVNDISKISEDYWTEFVLYLTVFFPTSHTTLYIDDFKATCTFLKSINRDLDKVIETKMIQQVIMSEAGLTFYKEYLFYSDQKNYINNNDFIQKKQHLIDKFEKYKNSILNQISN